MNIFWILTDSICSYERNDKFSLLPTYKKLIENEEGIFFNNVLTLFPSTAFSVLSMVTGKFPYQIFFDFLENPPKEIKNKIMNESYFSILKKNGFNIYSYICYDIGSNWFSDLTNTIINKERYKDSYQLDGYELNEEFFKHFKEVDLDKNNVFFIHYRAGDKKMDEALRDLVNFFKKENVWNDSIFLINSDHGYRTFRESKNPLHFDDIHIISLSPAVFLRIPKELNKKRGIINERIYLIDLWETILDYLGIEVNYDRKALSFRPILENNEKDFNKKRMVRGDAYLMFQPIKKSFIVMDDFKLEVVNNKVSLKRIITDKKDKKEEIIINNKNIEKKLYNYYLKIEKESEIIFKNYVRILFYHSALKNIKNKKILLPNNQFPPLLVEVLKEELEKNNKVFSDLRKINTNKNFDIAIFIFNRLTGYGISKLKKEIRKNNLRIKNFVYINTSLEKINKKEGYLNYVIENIKTKNKLLLKRPIDTIIWLIYFPIYLNMNLKRFYE